MCCRPRRQRHHRHRGHEKGFMNKLLLLTSLLAASAFGQTAVANNFSPAVKGITIGTTHCYMWGQSPGAGQVQVACYTNNTILKNTVMTVTANDDAGCFPFGAANICWVLKPNASAPQIDFQLTGLGTTGTNATLTGTF